MNETLKDFQINYRERFNKLKKQQRPFIDKYNRAKCRESKKKHYAEIMKYEDKLLSLEFERRK